MTLALVVAASLASGTTEAPRVHAGFMPGTTANYGGPVEPGAHSFRFSNSRIIGNVGMDAGLQYAEPTTGSIGGMWKAPGRGHCISRGSTTLIRIPNELPLVTEVPSDPEFIRTDRAHAVIPCPGAPPEQRPMGV